MSADELEVLDYLRPKTWTRTASDAWSATGLPHVPEINARAAQAILDGIAEADRQPASSALGLAITGPKGTGKTHLVTWARQVVQDRGGYYFLAEFTDGRGFWNNLAHSFLDGLRQPHSQEESQLLLLLKRLAHLADLDDDSFELLFEQRKPNQLALNRFVSSLRRVARRLAPPTWSTLRALVLLAAEDMDLEIIGDAYLRSAVEMRQGERSQWELHSELRRPRDLVDEITRLLALTGTSLLAVDQIDTLMNEHSRVHGESGDHELDAGARRLLEEIGQGFMDLYQTAPRTFSMIACLPETWIDLREHVIATAADRFRGEVRLETIRTPQAAAALIERTFKPGFDTAGFTPPYPTWPIRESCFDQAVHYSPRELLKRVGRHIDECRDRGVVEELEALDEAIGAVPPVHLSELTAAVEARFQELQFETDASEAFGEAVEDYRLPALLEAVVGAGAIEAGIESPEFRPSASANPDAHQRAHIENDQGTDQRTWSFRAIARTHPRAVKTRIDRFAETCGLGIVGNRAFLLRTAAWQTGPKTRESIKAFEARGGSVIELGPDDMRVLAAVEALTAEQPRGLAQWLAASRPVHSTSLGRAVFGVPGERDAAPTPVQPQLSLPSREEARPPIVFGTDFATGTAVGVELDALKRHLSVFAGTGSGKTVVVRRIIESCALQGVSSIVIDSNNDLARLGLPWPKRPEGFTDRDAEDAERYLAETEVVVWTPGRSAGRPLRFAPIPDFAAVRDSPDDLRAALDAAVESLAPRAKVAGNRAKDDQSRAVLREGLRFLADQGRSSLPRLIELLTDLPPEATTLARGQEFGAEMAENLRAAIINDPLMAEGATELDPGVLLKPERKRARVSVISLAGLATQDQRTAFVNELQMALFTWITRHPTDALGALLVMDEAQNFVPTGMKTACARSTAALAAQARKYGLGMVFATQAPKGIDNRIVGNTATQLYGRLSAPAQINAARDLARQRGGALLDAARLGAGEFYVATEGERFRKIRTAMCLSYHPASALTPEAVIALASDGER